MKNGSPTIKGIFVNSHIKAVQTAKGEEGVAELARRYGKSLIFKNTQDVPVRDEIRLIECAFDVLTQQTVNPEQRAFEAGRLHFKNFSTTPLARIIFSFYQKNFKLLMLHAGSIAGYVFSGVTFTSEEAGERSVRLTMKNNDYPIDHFRGLFQAWMDFSGLTGVVQGTEIDPNTYVYTMTWE